MGVHREKVLVVGGDSQIGQAVIAYLSQLGDYEVYGTSRHQEKCGKSVFFHDLADDNATLPSFDFGAALICAGITSIADCEGFLDLAMRTNVTNTVKLIDRLVSAGCYVVYLSSSAVFDGKKAFCGPGDVPNPQSKYGQLKRMVELHLDSKAFRNAAVLRITKIIGESTPFLQEWKKSVLSNSEVVAYTNKVLSPVLLSDVTKSAALLIQRKQTGLYQLGGTEESTYYEYAKKIFAHDERALKLIRPATDQRTQATGESHNSLITHLPTQEVQYGGLLETKRVTMGLMSGYGYLNDPKRLAFTLARYKFVSKMLSGANRVLEIGCADAFGTPIVMQEVKQLVACDFDSAFIDDVKRTHPFAGKIEFCKHDFVIGSLERQFDAAFCLDVLEHISKDVEDTFLNNICCSLTSTGMCVIGMPSLESQAYASNVSKLGHVNCKTGRDLKTFLATYFTHVFIFSMNDEVVHTGFQPMAHYLLALCCSPRDPEKRAGI